MTIATDDLALALELTLLDAIDLEQRGGPGTALLRDGASVQRLTNPNSRRLACAHIAVRWIGGRLFTAGGAPLMRMTLHAVAEQYAVRSERMQSIATHAWAGIAK